MQTSSSGVLETEALYFFKSAVIDGFFHGTKVPSKFGEIQDLSPKFEVFGSDNVCQS